MSYCCFRAISGQTTREREDRDVIYGYKPRNDTPIKEKDKVSKSKPISDKKTSDVKTTTTKQPKPAK